MAYITPLPRIRGLSLLLGGTLVAIFLVAVGFATGTIDLGLGAPEVRIDAPGAAAWPQYPD